MNARRRVLMGTATVVVLGGAIGLAGAKGWLEPLDRAYAEWSLRSRVAGFWNARIEGDNETASSYMHASQTRSLGGAVRYFEFDINDVSIQDNVAHARVALTYKVALPGYAAEAAKPDRVELNQRWVREGWTWYLDPKGTEEKDEDLTLLPVNPPQPREERPGQPGGR